MNNTVSYFSQSCVEFIEGDDVRHSQNDHQQMHHIDCNRGDCFRSLVKEFAWRTLFVRTPEIIPCGSLLVEVEYYNNSKDYGVKLIQAREIEWGMPTVHKAWRPFLDSSSYVQSARNIQLEQYVELMNVGCEPDEDLWVPECKIKIRFLMAALTVSALVNTIWLAVLCS